MKKILVDIDHTLSNAFPRDPMIGICSWDEYHSESHKDDPCNDMIDLLMLPNVRDHFDLVGLTSRPEKFRTLTMQWLAKNEIDLDDLWMRPNNDYRPAPIVKIDLCKAHIGENWHSEVLCMIDDNDRVIEKFRGEGITCLQIFNKR